MLLRITVPADLYKSGILIEFEGLEVRLRTDLGERGKNGTPRSQGSAGQTRKLSKGVVADRARSTQPLVHDPGGSPPPGPSNTDNQDASDEECAQAQLPTTVDLAQSFLQTAPQAEKDGLEAAVVSSHHLEQPSVMDEVGEDASAYGVGAALSIPGFLADFLTGVGDRIQLKIFNLMVDLDLTLDLSPGSSTGSANSDASDIVTVQLSVEHVNMNGVLPLQPASDIASNHPTSGANSDSSQPSSAARCFTFENIQIRLVCDDSLFVKLSRFDALSSPAAAQTKSVGRAENKNLANTSQPAPPKNPTDSAVIDHAVFEGNDMIIPQAPKSKASSVTSDGEIYANAMNEGEGRDPTSASAWGSSLGESRHDDSMLADSFYTDDEGQILAFSDSSRLREETDQKLRGRSPVQVRSKGNHSSNNIAQRSANLKHSSFSYPRSEKNIRPNLVDSFSDLRNIQLGQDINQCATELLLPKSFRQMSKASGETSGSISPLSEDLTQSRIFSHEEAESMYMSAISHVSYDNHAANTIKEKLSISESVDQDDDSNDSKLRAVEQPGDLVRPTRSITSMPTREHSPALKPTVAPLASDDIEQSDLRSYAHVVGQEITSSQNSTGSSARFQNSIVTAKRFLAIDSIKLELPCQSSSLAKNEADNQTLERNSREPKSSILHTDSIQVNKAKRAIKANTVSRTRCSDAHELSPQVLLKEKPPSSLDQQISVEIGKLEILADIGLTKLTTVVIQQNLELFGYERTEKEEGNVLKSSPSHAKLSIADISWKFLDSVKGLILPSRILERPAFQLEPLSDDAEILLMATIRDLDLLFSKEEDFTEAKLSVRKISFGYVSEDILSFDSELKIRDSARDILQSTEKDMILTLTQSPKLTKINLTTLPLRFALDLRRLDETFAWFGGFSGILGLGSSMMSTVTVVNSKPGPSPGSESRKSRGVHFEQPEQIISPQEREKRSKKVTARIGGLSMILQGANCSLRLESTALKLVSRAEGVGLQVDKLKFSGPYLEQDVENSSITASLANIRSEYLSTPNETDLARLLALLSPSNDKYERDDDILVDTLLHQRRQGGVIRITVESFKSQILDLGHLEFLPDLIEELKKLSKVAKYLPEDDRPGILTFCLVRDLGCEVFVDDAIGYLALVSTDFELAHVTLPSLTALGVRSVQLHRNHDEELLGEASSFLKRPDVPLPMIMARFIGNEMEPVVKVKIQNLRIEYHVSTIMSCMGLPQNVSTEAVVSDMVSSIVTLTGQRQLLQSPSKFSSQASSKSDKSFVTSKIVRLDVTIRDSIVGLNPLNSKAKGLVVLTNAQLNGILPKEGQAKASFEVKTASLMVVNDTDSLVATSNAPRSGLLKSDKLIQELLESGFVSVSYISSAKATLNVVNSEFNGRQAIDIEIRDDLFILETCADSTQTLQAILNGLKPPTPPSKELKYRTEIIPVEDMLASFSGDAFIPTPRSLRKDDTPLGLDEGDMVDDDVPQSLEYVSSFYNPNPKDLNEGVADGMLDDDLESLASPPAVRKIGDPRHLESFREQYEIAPGNAPLDFQENHFGESSDIGGAIHGLDAKQKTCGLADEIYVRGCLLRVHVRGVHIIWNLYDGYDWQHTRDIISKAVMNVENRAAERLSFRDRNIAARVEDEEESEIGDFLFNSIYIGVPANRDPNDLARQVNRNIDDLASETESYAASATSALPGHQSQKHGTKGKKLRLVRSKHHKMTFELKGVSVDWLVYPADSEETQSSIDVRVQDLDIFDHVPSSTWKKFATYMHDAGERESGTNMIHIEILNVKPVPNLAASEIVLKVRLYTRSREKAKNSKVSILPLRLHVDQDALDFMTRFFDFKDDSVKSSSIGHEMPFLQRVEVNAVRLKLDFKPKRVDYAGLRSGRTNEFMNFFILDRADMVLRHVIIYGVSGFDKLSKTLNDIWMPDIKRNQLPGVLAGLAPVRSLVNVGAGVRDLVVVPIREYKKDGRIVRSFQKGALAFAKTTTTELMRLGAKLAIGTQTVLQGAEDFLNQPSQQRSDVSAGWEVAQLEEDEKKHISLYADQPVGVIQGLRGAYANLERDLLTTRDAIIAMPGEIMESGTAGGAARAVFRSAPTVILRPALGVSKAVGQTLMGVTNSLDPDNRRRIEEVSDCFRSLFKRQLKLTVIRNTRGIDNNDRDD